MENNKLGRAPNYTNACIVMFGINLTLLLLFLFALWGLLVAVFVALSVNHWLNWLDFKRRSEEQRWAHTPTN